MKQLKTLAAIRQMSIKYRDLVGVYFLFSGDELVYIGQSISIRQRICVHKGKFEFDSYAFIECEKAQLNDLEEAYIRQFTPPQNISHTPRMAEVIEKASAGMRQHLARYRADPR